MDWKPTLVASKVIRDKKPSRVLKSVPCATAYRNGVPDEEIMAHTRHRSLTTMRSCVRRAKLDQATPAGKLGF